MADANKRIIQRLFEESWMGSFDAIDEFISPDYVGHDPSEQEPTRGPEGIKEFIARYRGRSRAHASPWTTSSRRATKSQRAGQPGARIRARSPGSGRPART